MENAVHLSLHESGQWHMKVHGQKAMQWLRPSEITPGFTRAVSIVQPNGVAVENPLPLHPILKLRLQ